MELFVGILIVSLIVIFLVIFGIAKLFTPGTFTFFVLFIIGKKANILKLSWWWILIGLLIPF